jgi:drug/metabolite transporter (DMT)-like permease
MHRRCAVGKMLGVKTGMQSRGLLWAGASALGAAAMVIPWKLANQAGDPSISTLVLLATGALGSSVLGGLQRLGRSGARRRIRRVDLIVAAMLAVFTLAGNHASAVAIRELSPALLNVLLRTDFLFVAILGWPLLGERVGARFWTGAPLVLVGLMVLQGVGVAGVRSAATGSGVVWAIGAAACFSGLSLITRRFIHQIDPVAVNSIRLWLSVVYWLVLNPWPEPMAIPRAQWSNAALAAIAGPFLGRLALMQSARYVPARVTTLATLTTPLFTLVLAFALLAEWPRPHELWGGALMLCGIALPLLPRRGR